MGFRLEHRFPMKPPAASAISRGLGLFIIFTFAAAVGLAQNNNSSSGGHSSASAAPAFAATAPASHAQASSSVTVSPNAPHSPVSGWHPPGQPQPNPQPKPHPQPGNGAGNAGSYGGYLYYPYFYAVPVPYPADSSSADADATPDADSADDDANYQGGPTVFDRRGSGAASYVPPADSEPADAQADVAMEDGPESARADAGEDAETVDPTVLVFKDGHQIEVENYAVVDQTLYDLTEGHRRKIALAELDLPATEKLNDDRGVTFELPSTVQAN